MALNIDLSKASDDELLQIRNDVLRRLAGRVKAGGGGGGADLLYDRHGSGHSKNSAYQDVASQLER